jgi:4-amino-4-deoxy-L-arabinose transferase-like glycosyltransferase
VSDATTLRRESLQSTDREIGGRSLPGVRSAVVVHGWISPIWIVAALLAVSAPIYFARGIGIFDDSLYLKIGQLILDGLKPYRDFYDNKPPGVYYVSAVIAAIGGRGWLAPRVFLFLFGAAFQIAIIRWVHRHFGASVAAITAVLNGLSYPLAQGYSLHTEPFGAAAAFGACALVLADEASGRRWIEAGALLGLATAFKQTGVLYLGAFGLFAVFDAFERRNRFNALALRLVALLSGFLAIVTAITLVFVAQGLGPAMFNGVVIGTLKRGGGGLASWQSIVVTWVRSPSLLAFLASVVVIAGTKRTWHVMDDRRRRTWVLFTLVGLLSILPTLKTNLVGHYLQPSAFALSAGCALLVDAYLRSASTRASRLVGIAGMAFAAGYFVAICGGSLQVWQRQQLRDDLALQNELRQTLDTRLEANDPVLCVSLSSAARLYLMSGRLPFNGSLYFYPTLNDVFSLDDARRTLFEGRPVGAVVEIHPEIERPELTDEELTALRSIYQIIPVGPQREHLLLVLIKDKRQESSTPS